MFRGPVLVDCIGKLSRRLRSRSVRSENACLAVPMSS
jgi:hypothetical protein